MTAIKQKILTHLEKEEIFYQVIAHESNFIDFQIHWETWMENADYRLSPDQDNSIRRYYMGDKKIYTGVIPNFFVFPRGHYKYLSKEGNTFFEAFQLSFGYNNYTAINEYLNLFKLNKDVLFNNLFGLEPINKDVVRCYMYEQKTIPNEFNINNKIFKIEHKHHIYDIHGFKIGICIEYSSGTEYFYIYGRFILGIYNSFYLKLGRPNGKINLFNLDLICKSDSTIIFIMSLRSYFNQKEKTIKTDKSCYLLTSCFDTSSNIDDIDFDNLHGKDIIFLPESTKDSILKCIEYIKRLEIDNTNTDIHGKIIVKSIKISKIFTTLMEPDEISRLLESDDPFERFIAESACNGDLNINKQSLYTVEEFMDKLIEVGLLSTDGTISKSPCLVAFDEEQYSPSENSLEFYLRPSMITGIIGESETGKTMLGYTIASSLASGSSVLDFNVTKYHKVLYFDAETGEYDSKTRLDRIKNGYDISESLLEKNLKLIILSSGIYHDIQEIDLLDSAFQEWINKKIAEYDPEYIFFDNLASLGYNLDHHIKWIKVKDFFKSLSRKKYSVIYFHHLKRDGNISGTNKIEDLSQNIIKMRGKSIVMSEYSSFLSKKIYPQDCVTELEYKKSKGDVTRNNKKQVWMFKFAPEDMKIDGKWQQLDVPKMGMNISFNKEITNKAREVFCERMEREPILEGNQKDIKWKQDLLLLFAIDRNLASADPSGSWFSLHDVRFLFDSSDQNKRDMLKQLVNLKILDFSSNQKANKWRYRDLPEPESLK